MTEIIIGLAGLLALGVVARSLHKRAEPPPQVHSNAVKGSTHDKKAIAASGSEGQGFG